MRCNFFYMNYPWVSRGVRSPSCLLTQFLLPQSWPAVMGLVPHRKLELNSCPCHPTAGRVWATPVKLLQERAISFLLLFGDSGYFCDRNRDNISGIWWTYFMCFLICSYCLKAFCSAGYGAKQVPETISEYTLLRLENFKWIDFCLLLSDFEIYGEIACSN